MKPTTLGRLTKVNLGEVFASEPEDFTPWLALEENLALLGDEISISLQFEAREKPVGPFRADILCKDRDTDNWVVIENQIESTDHPHLGQLLTYAAGLQAVTIVWVAERFKADHRAALDWLNEHTDENINFFGIEIELWKIGNSEIAPKFNIVSQPNDWSRTVKAAAKETAEISEHKHTQLRFWLAFKDFMEKNSQIRCQKPYPQHWMYHSIGTSGFRLVSVISLYNSETYKKGPETRVELDMFSEHAKQHFAALQKHRAHIEQECGGVLTWHNPERKNACRIYMKQSADFLQEDQWPSQQQWLKEKLELFHRVFGPIVQNLEITDVAMAAEAGA
ncbi:MAG TPA: DUF4268 domain-containing protein [Candidatus Angelobacter sp.]